MTQTTADDGSSAVPRERFTPDGLPAEDPETAARRTAQAVQQALQHSGDPGSDVGLDAADPARERDPFGDVAPNAGGGTAGEPGALALQDSVRIVDDATAGGLGEVPRDGSLRYATEEDMAGIWEGTAVPLDAIEGGARVVTPRVGRVRAVLVGGEVFEGRLYAVGEGNIWIDTHLGRMALVGRRLAKVEHILSEEGSVVLGDPGSEAFAGLQRVRVRVPGGMFFGKLIHREGDQITLITEEGARITLEGAEVEPAPINKRVVVKGYEKDLAGG